MNKVSPNKTKYKVREHKQVHKKINVMLEQVPAKYDMAATTTYSDFMHTKLSFGKYKGIYMKDVPTNYLKWLIMNHSDRGMCEMFAIELQRRLPSLRRE